MARFSIARPERVVRAVPGVEQPIPGEHVVAVLDVRAGVARLDLQPRRRRLLQPEVRARAAGAVDVLEEVEELVCGRRLHLRVRRGVARRDHERVAREQPVRAARVAARHVISELVVLAGSERAERDEDPAELSRRVVPAGEREAEGRQSLVVRLEHGDDARRARGLRGNGARGEMRGLVRGELLRLHAELAVVDCRLHAGRRDRRRRGLTARHPPVRRNRHADARSGRARLERDHHDEVRLGGGHALDVHRGIRRDVVRLVRPE